MSNTPITKIPTPPFASMFAKPEEVGRPKSMILYGRPGTRKTSIAGGIYKVPGFKRILYIDIDNGSEVFVNDPAVHQGVMDGDINIVQIDKLDPQAFSQLAYFIGSKSPETGEWSYGEAFNPEWGYDVVIVDAFDVAQEVGVDWHLKHAPLGNGGKPNTQAAWGEISKWSSDFAWALQNHKEVTGILVMHSKEETDGDGKFGIKPKLAGSIKDNIAGIPSLVVYLAFEPDPEESGKDRFVATLGNSSVTVTKSRYNLPDKIVDFTLPGFFEAIKTTKPVADEKAAA